MRLKHLVDGKAGFTLLELLVIITILGIIMAIFTPTYSSWRLQSRLDEATQQFARDVELQKTTSKRLNNFQEIRLDRQNPNQYYLNNKLIKLPAGAEVVPVFQSISVPFYPPYGTTNAPERSFKVQLTQRPSDYYRFVRVIGVTGKVIVKYE